MTKILLLIISATAIFNCSDARVASQNISKASEYFEIKRRIIFFNGITDSYLLSIEGFCSIEEMAQRLEVTCKQTPGKFKKHYLGLSDNVSYFIEQLEPADVAVGQYRVIFKPSVIIPDVEFK